MTSTEKKKKLRSELLKPKKRLREERLKKEYTTDYVAELIGLQRRQYALKESGQYPFSDYEMYILSEEFEVGINELFYAN